MHLHPLMRESEVQTISCTRHSVAKETFIPSSAGGVGPDSSSAEGSSHSRSSGSRSTGSTASAVGSVDAAAFTENNGWTQIVELSTITRDLASTMKTPCISQHYMLRTKWYIRVGGLGREQLIEKAFRVTVHPPLSPNAAATPIQPLIGRLIPRMTGDSWMGEEREALPEYSP
ncbi:uncharacterized protein B0I36DRAFT_338631 [Microdochium trichocladiopsis]|uniref:Uncharacterized protein n=1 Tax=Microdochium trichocladiopsis TaxID=1682393 RepID=A0A9P8XS22_9PEZI|nr:uncharacterized protein B0I36DRAFT_338631 [Microdochium trichocladiopsis]KAH7014363.1 hypothetical protein B0I36DRAFT_338631 [Microdochium trichocladiopsis]